MIILIGCASTVASAYIGKQGHAGALHHCRVMGMLSANQLQKSFASWMQAC